MSAGPRPRARRIRDALHRLEHDIDCWVATADPGTGEPHMVPLSFLWGGAALLVSTPARSPAGRNLARGGPVRVGVGPTRDVVIVDGVAEALAPQEVPDSVGGAFAAHTGFDPRRLEGYGWFRIRPRRVQAWREADELPGRDLMRDGRWLGAYPGVPSPLKETPVSSPSSPDIVRGVDFVAVPAHDIERAAAFYGDTLGLPRSVYAPDRGFAEFETGNLTISIIVPAKMGLEHHVNRNAIALHVDDVQAARSALEAAGVAFEGDIFDTGVCHMAFFADPDGNALMLHHRYAPRHADGGAG